MIGMDKIEFFIPLQPLEQGRGLMDLNAVPADVGDGKVTGEPLYPAREDAQARFLGSLLAGGKQGLQGYADAEEGLARVEVTDKRVAQALFPQGASYNFV